jgi:hypothetical protein
MDDVTRLKVERFGGSHMSNVSDCCSHCGEETKSRRREFSEQAYSALLVWGEIQASTVDQAICENCYIELRDVLIDRADDIVQAAQESAEPRKQVFAKEAPAKKVASTKKVEPAPRQKVRKAS